MEKHDEETRAGFIALALEKNRKAGPFVEEAKVLKVLASKAKTPKDLLKIRQISNSLLTASGISDKAKNHLREKDRQEAIKGFIENFLEPSGKAFIDELVYRFLLTRGDSLGGTMRNLAGKLGEWKFTRILISTCSIRGIGFAYLDSKTKKWKNPMVNLKGKLEIEKQTKGLHWISNKSERTLIYNLTVPAVKRMLIFVCLTVHQMKYASVKIVIQRIIMQNVILLWES